MSRALTGLIAAALLAVGCGEREGDPPTTVPERPAATTPEQVPTNRAAIVEACLVRARQIPDDGARRTAEEACHAAQTGDPSEAREAAREQCLEAAERIVAGPQRDRVRQACERIRP